VDAPDEVRSAIEPLAADHGVDLYDVELVGGILRVLVDREGGVDIDVIGQLTRAVSARLDEIDPLPGRYTLEVSSPGLERRLRRPEHYARSVGTRVVVKTVPGTPGERRVEGELAGADDDGFEVRSDDGATRRLAYAEVDRTRTVFEWGPAPKPGSPQTRKKRAATS
jgi:ribosome maturation factor RimP